MNNQSNTTGTASAADRVTLRNIKHAAFASQETECFNATVYIDGVKEGYTGKQLRAMALFLPNERPIQPRK